MEYTTCVGFMLIYWGGWRLEHVLWMNSWMDNWFINRMTLPAVIYVCIVLLLLKSTQCWQPFHWLKAIAIPKTVQTAGLFLCLSRLRGDSSVRQQTVNAFQGLHKTNGSTWPIFGIAHGLSNPCFLCTSPVLSMFLNTEGTCWLYSFHTVEA